MNKIIFVSIIIVILSGYRVANSKIDNNYIIDLGTVEEDQVEIFY